MKKFAALAGYMLLAACANTNTGEISYRRATPPATSLAIASTAYANACPGAWGTATERAAAASTNNVCKIMLEARLDRQNVGFGTPISTNDVYSLRLEHGVISELSEANFSFRHLVRGSSPFRATGEVVVLANVFEFGSSNPSFLDPTDISTARVVYYSDDVETFQDLNFSNIPLQAPVAYGGNPIGIQLIVLELDRTSGPAKALISRLAEMGTSNGLVPGGPVTETLLSLGSSLLQRNQDDMIFEYRLVLDPAGATGSSASAPFEAGRYVVMRNENRITDIEWENYRLDHNTGRVYFWPNVENEPVPQIDHTYFTINVVKHASMQPSAYTMQTLASFNTALEEALDERDEPLNVITERLETELLRVRAGNFKSDLALAWQSTMEKARLYSSYLPQLDEEEEKQCELLPTSISARDEASLAAYNNALEFIALYAQAKEASTGDDSEAEDVLSVSDRREILSLLAQFFTPFSDQTVNLEVLSDPATFEGRFLATPADFAREVLAEAKRDNERSNCEILEANGKAPTAAP